MRIQNGLSNPFCRWHVQGDLARAVCSSTTHVLCTVGKLVQIIEPFSTNIPIQILQTDLHTFS